MSECKGVCGMDDLIKGLYSCCENGKLNVQKAKEYMECYKSSSNDWQKYVFWDDKKYTRNLVNDGEQCDGKKCFNLIVLCWGSGQGSTIHDHSNSECLMKILQGNAREERYKFPSGGNQEKMELVEEKRYKLDEVAHINDSMGLHRVSNPLQDEGLVTLHLYFPPFAECQCFNESTSETTVGQMTYYSKFGTKS